MLKQYASIGVEFLDAVHVPPLECFTSHFLNLSALPYLKCKVSYFDINKEIAILEVKNMVFM